MINLVKGIFLLAFVSFTIPQCNSQQIPKPHPVIPTDSEYCKAGCEHLMTLKDPRDGKIGCEEARPLSLPDGGIESCESYCVSRQSAGRSIHPSCWVNIQNCLEIDKICRQK